MPRFEIHGPAGDEIRILASIEFIDGRNSIRQTHDVGIYPPAALFREQVVPKKVGERGRRPLSKPLGLVNKDLVFTCELGGVADPYSSRHGEIRVISVKIDVMSARNKRGETKQLIRRERLAVPERLKSVTGGSAGIHTA
jgi:hypothetical protein